MPAHGQIVVDIFENMEQQIKRALQSLEKKCTAKKKNSFLRLAC